MESIIETLKKPEVAAAALGALLGAATAFLLVIFRDSYKRVAERKRTHYTALVVLDSELTSQKKIIRSNIRIVSFFARALKKGSLYWSVLHIIDFDSSRINDLHNLKLIIAFEEYAELVRQHNADVANIQSTYKMLQESYVDGKIDADNFKKNCNYIADKMQNDMLGFFKALLLVNRVVDDMIKHLVKEDLTWGMKLQRRLVGQTKFDIKPIEKAARKEHKAEIKKLDKRTLEEMEKDDQNSL